MLPDRVGIKPAPGRLKIVQSFMNTVNPKSERDDFNKPEAFREWLTESGLLEGRAKIGSADVAQAKSVRDALRDLLDSGRSAQARAEAVATLNRMTRSAQMAVSFDADGKARIAPLAPSVDGALGKIIAIVVDAMTDGTWANLKLCAGHDCSWAFYDRTKNHSGTWCNITDCGNVAKVRAYRARQTGRP
jgi:predicted RNA-binding Zn ribbon-like protein